MAAAAPPPSRPRPNPWLGPLLVGVCFGVGYGLTQRLLTLNLPGLIHLGQGFSLKPFPGTGLEALRQRFGQEGQQIRGDLDLLELEAQSRQQDEEMRKRQDALDAEEKRQSEAPEPLALPEAERPQDGGGGGTPAATPAGPSAATPSGNPAVKPEAPPPVQPAAEPAPPPPPSPGPRP
ncbi:hypothetical protein [Synechococcus sp. CS-1328]|uniref:hypothetical protein n=1 Tax=Synechococcus sp. CS-1328 TaxID=2847976 RepID=UPI00223BD32F|nr:hypothetical protein [Synechococcus sp. CS-1328]MCT0223699.1 hypothetical protein [Synechococcus sp. CS-1328]